MLQRIFCLFLLLFSIAPFTSCQEEVAPPTRPKVLCSAIDDLRTELGVYGNAMVKSPNMDNLAAMGALFTHHYVQVLTYGTSRHALLTGCRPYKPIPLKNNAIEEEVSNSVEPEVPETFIHRFKQEGYHTVGIGKISHYADGSLYGYKEAVSEKRELPRSWNELLFDYGKWKTGWNAFFTYATGEHRQSLKKQVKPYEMAAVEDQGYRDGLTTNLAVSKLRDLKNNKKPFFYGGRFF